LTKTPTEFVYRFGGLRFRCSEPFGRLEVERDVDQAPEADWRLLIESGPPPAPDEHLFEWPGRYGLTLGQIGSKIVFSARVGGAFLISPETRELRCFAEGPDQEAWPDVLVRRVLPRACVVAGALAVHGASVSQDDSAVLLVASSGTGKSTLSAALEREGWSLLSDDISILWPETKRIAATVLGASLWPDARQGLDVPEALCRPLVAYDGKKAYVSGEERPVGRPDLKAVVDLVRSKTCERPRLDRLAPRETLRLLQRHLIHCNPADPKELASAFARLGAIADGVAGYKLTYPSRFDALKAVGRELEALL
jgi:hypothetical protein